MESLVAILEANFTLIQTAGIVGSFLLASWALFIDAKVRRASNLIAITAHHREIWSQIYSTPSLTRITDSDADLDKRPITTKEWHFTRSLFLHLASAYQAASDGLLATPEGLRSDVRDFLLLPIPRKVWIEIRMKQNAKFRQFVDSTVQ